MEVLRDIINERNRQDDLKAQGKFPHTCADVPGLTDGVKCAVLTEENGEVARVLCELAQGKLSAYAADEALYEELVQVAAVAVAWCESLQYKRRVHSSPEGAVGSAGDVGPVDCSGHI